MTCSAAQLDLGSKAQQQQPTTGCAPGSRAITCTAIPAVPAGGPLPLNTYIHLPRPLVSECFLSLQLSACVRENKHRRYTTKHASLRLRLCNTARSSCVTNTAYEASVAHVTCCCKHTLCCSIICCQLEWPHRNTATAHVCSAEHTRMLACLPDVLCVATSLCQYAGSGWTVPQQGVYSGHQHNVKHFIS